MGRGLICQAIECCTSGVGLQAQRGADRVAGLDRKVDLLPGVDPDHASDVLVDIDRHFHVDVKETETEERAKVVRKPRIRGVVQIRYCPGS